MIRKLISQDMYVAFKQIDVRVYGRETSGSAMRLTNERESKTAGDIAYWANN